MYPAIIAALFAVAFFAFAEDDNRTGSLALGLIIGICAAVLLK